MIEAKSSSNEILSYSENRRRGFHEKYLSICKLKLLQPLQAVKLKQRNINILDFYADRIRANDWLAICGALHKDKTLKFASIKLRKNDEAVLENVDTLKKSRAVTSVPVIYSKFLLTKLVDALQSMLIVNNVLEVLTLEGLPFGNRYMMSLAKGLYSNQSIRILNLSRSNMGDEGCEILCANIKHLKNIETLNISQCNLGVKGAEAVRDLIKLQKIRRFSEAWIRSLRYQNIEPESFGGLKNISISNNPQIGDLGLKILTDELCEDVWIKDVEMQNCGLTDVAANEIINCLNINKTILNFNVANNYDMPEHLYRQIWLRHGISDNESCDSGDSKISEKKITRSQLLDKIKLLEEQLDSEMYRRQQAEKLTQQLKDVMENQKQIAEIEYQARSIVPEGFTLVPNHELQKLMILVKGSSMVTPSSASNIAVRLRRRRRNPIKRVQSLVIENPINKVITSKSEASIRTKKSIKKKPFIEQNIGDTVANNKHQILKEKERAFIEDDGVNVLQMFIKTQTTQLTDMDIFSIFRKPSSTARAPQNLENESD